MRNMMQKLTSVSLYSVYREICRRLSSKVPDCPTWIPVDKKKLPPEPKIDKELVDHLERLSLVEFSNKEAIDRLSKAIAFANQLYMVDTDGVEPMDSVLEDREIFLQKDEITDGNCRNEVLKNAVKTIEEYYVAPPGNIPLQAKKRDYGNDDT